MVHGITGIEHIEVTVSNLDDTVDYLGRMGFTLTAHSGGEDGSDRVISLLFPDDRIEFREQSKTAGGAIVAGLSTKDLDASRKALSDKGVDTEEAEAVTYLPGTNHKPLHGRQLLLKDTGQEEVDFHICMLPDLPPGTATEWMSHANGARSLGVVTIVVEDPESFRPWAARLFGESATVMTDNTLAVFPGHSGFLFVTPDHLSVLFPEFDIGDVGYGRIAGITIVVEDVARTAAVLAEGGVAFQWGQADRVVHVPRSPHLDLLLEFTTRERFGSVASFFG